jgi:hypothetical protein
LINVSAIVLSNRVIGVPPFRSEDAGDDSAEGDSCAVSLFVVALDEQLGMNEQGKDVNGARLAFALANRTALTKFCVTSSISIIHAFLTNFLSPTTSIFMTQQHLLNIKSINT